MIKKEVDSTVQTLSRVRWKLLKQQKIIWIVYSVKSEMTRKNKKDYLQTKRCSRKVALWKEWSLVLSSSIQKSEQWNLFKQLNPMVKYKMFLQVLKLMKYKVQGVDSSRIWTKRKKKFKILIELILKEEKKSKQIIQMLRVKNANSSTLINLTPLNSKLRLEVSLKIAAQQLLWLDQLWMLRCLCSKRTKMTWCQSIYKRKSNNSNTFMWYLDSVNQLCLQSRGWTSLQWNGSH